MRPTSRRPCWSCREARIALFPPEHHAALLKAFPGAKAVVYPGLGHNFLWEQPAVVAGDIAKFLEASARN